MSDYADKINKLMAKAESTEFPEEAEALLEKAQELMTTYGIEEAMLREAGKEVIEEITELVLSYTGGMRKTLFALGHRLADHNGCRSFFRDNRHDSGPRRVDVIVIGFPKDLERIEMLDTSLKLQCAVALKKFVKEHVDPTWHRGVKRNEKREFVLGYIAGVSAKLRQAQVRATEVATEKNGPGVALAIRSRKDQVDDWTDKKYTGLRPVRSRIQRGSHSAKEVGVQAGERADIGESKLGSTKEITA